MARNESRRKIVACLCLCLYAAYGAFIALQFCLHKYFPQPSAPLLAFHPFICPSASSLVLLTSHALPRFYQFIILLHMSIRSSILARREFHWAYTKIAKYLDLCGFSETDATDKRLLKTERTSYSKLDLWHWCFSSKNCSLCSHNWNEWIKNALTSEFHALSLPSFMSFKRIHQCVLNDVPSTRNGHTHTHSSHLCHIMHTGDCSSSALWPHS